MSEPVSEIEVSIDGCEKPWCDFYGNIRLAHDKGFSITLSRTGARQLRD